MSKRRSGKATLNDVAKLAEVHPSTVSRALDPVRVHLVNEQTRRRVDEAVAELEYEVNSFAQSLRKNSSGMIGVVVADVANPFLPPVLRGIEQELRTQQRLLLIAETHDSSATLHGILDHFISRRVDALIVSAAHQGDEDKLREVAQRTPVVLAVRGFAGDRLPTVRHDDVLGGQIAARHLVELGHRELAQLRGPMDVSSFSGRAAGYGSVLATTSARDVSTGDMATAPTVQEGYRLASALLARDAPPPTAIFAHNDLMAVGAVDALKEAGLRCPQDVSIVGYNDAPLTDHVDPPLTTIRFPGLEVGRRAARLAIALMSGEETAGDSRPLEPAIVVRASTAEPPAGPPAGSG